jgi:hypothetical protein
MTDPTPLSPAALAIWEAFNEDEAGVFVDYGDKLAAALRAAADQVVPLDPLGPGGWDAMDEIRASILAIATELSSAKNTSEND